MANITNTIAIAMTTAIIITLASIISGTSAIPRSSTCARTSVTALGCIHDAATTTTTAAAATTTTTTTTTNKFWSTLNCKPFKAPKSQHPRPRTLEPDTLSPQVGLGAQGIRIQAEARMTLGTGLCGSAQALQGFLEGFLEGLGKRSRRGGSACGFGVSGFQGFALTA